MACFERYETYVQKKVLYGTEQQRPDVQTQRAWWRVEMLGVDPKRLVFLDETWTKTNMTRLRGRALRGKRLVDYAPHGHWKTTTFLAALRVDGLTAPLVIDGPINGDMFVAYVRQALAPTLRKDDIIIMDNLSSHKVKGVREAIEAVGARLVYLPPYSPDFNPIEQVFSKLKSLLRKAKERTLEGLWQQIGNLMDCFTPTECKNYFRHCGYQCVLI